MTLIKESNFQAGELYYFCSEPDVATGIWGLFDCYDSEGRLRLEVWSCDFASFCAGMIVSQQYVYTRLATRDELRDFAYNMGYERV